MTENLTEKKLTARQRRALEGLALGHRVTQVARDVGVSRDTIYRWLKQPEFVAELRRLGDAALERTQRSLAALSEDAATTLADGMLKDQPIQARLRAAGMVLQHAPAWAELVDILRRIEELEKEAQR